MRLSETITAEAFELNLNGHLAESIMDSKK